MWAFVCALSITQAVPPFAVLTVRFLSDGTRISGCVLRQNESIDTHIKNTETTPIICNQTGQKRKKNRYQ